jgi:hypothetical protein
VRILDVARDLDELGDFGLEVGLGVLMGHNVYVVERSAVVRGMKNVLVV